MLVRKRKGTDSTIGMAVCAGGMIGVYFSVPSAGMMSRCCYPPIKVRATHLEIIQDCHRGVGARMDFF